MSKYKPYEAPQYMQDYAQTATDPFGRSMLGQKLAMEKLEEMTDTNYEEPINASMPDSGLPEEAGVAGDGITKYLFGGMPNVKNAGKNLLARALPKQAAKMGVKGGLRFIPGLGWAMGAADLIDTFAYPIYDHLPGGVGDYLTWRDTTQGEQ